MMGRAGRPQYDTKGVVVLMTQRDKVEKFQGNSLMKEDLESHFGKKLAENLNAEVALGSIKDIQNAVDYVKSTFYYIRLKKNPEFYGCKRNEVIEEYLEEACKKLLQEMQEYDLLQFEKTKIRSLELGCEMSRFYVVFATIKKLFLEFNGKNGDGGLEKVLRVLSQATEFEGFRSKLEERGKLKILNERNKFKVKGAISTFDKKSFVLLQSWVQRENIEDWELMRDSTEMVGLHWRILSCFKKFFLKRKQPDNLIATIKLCKYIGARTWEDNPLTILRQIPGIGEKFAKILKDSRIDSFEKVLGCNNGMLEMLCGKNAPFGENIRGFVKKIPNIEIRLKGKNGRKISFEVQNLHSKENEEICNAFLIFYNRNKSVFLFKFLDLKRVGGQIMEFDILLGADISNLPLKIAVLNEKFIGFDRNYILDKDFNFFENTKEEEKIRKEEEFDKKIQKEYNDSELIDELLEDFYNKEKKDGKKKEKTFINNNNSLNLEKNKKTQEIGGINYNTSGIIRENLENNIPEIAKSSNFKKEEQNINNNYLKPQEKEAKLTSRNQKINQKTIKWFQEKQNYQEFYSLFEDIF